MKHCFFNVLKDSLIRVLEEMLADCPFITIPVLPYEIMAFSDSVQSKSSIRGFLVRSRIADINIFCLRSHKEFPLIVAWSACFISDGFCNQATQLTM